MDACSGKSSLVWVPHPSLSLSLTPESRCYDSLFGTRGKWVIAGNYISTFYLFIYFWFDVATDFLHPLRLGPLKSLPPILKYINKESRFHVTR